MHVCEIKKKETDSEEKKENMKNCIHTQNNQWTGKCYPPPLATPPSTHTHIYTYKLITSYEKTSNTKDKHKAKERKSGTKL